jgi:hypothetical protein
MFALLGEKRGDAWSLFCTLRNINININIIK